MMDVSDVELSTSSGTFHGIVVGGLLPVKTSSKNNVIKNFDGRCSDQKKTVRLILFDPKLCSRLDKE